MRSDKKLTPSLSYYAAVAFSLLCSLTGFSQTHEGVVAIIKNESLTTTLKFSGERAAIRQIITDSARYPGSAIKDRIGGQVTVDFIIDTFGMVKPDKINAGIRPDLDNEALRLVGLLNGWTPPSKNGKKFEVYFRLSFVFFPDSAFEKEYKKVNSINNTDFVVYGNK